MDTHTLSLASLQKDRRHTRVGINTSVVFTDVTCE